MAKFNKHDITLIGSMDYLLMSWVDFLEQKAAGFRWVVYCTSIDFGKSEGKKGSRVRE